MIPLLLGGMLSLLTLFQVYRNQIYLQFFGEPKVASLQAGAFRIDLEPERNSSVAQEWLDQELRVMPIKVSIPFSSTPKNGCEAMYGAVVEFFPEGRYEQHSIVLNRMRSLIRFQYDYKNRRCESKDLSLNVRDPMAKFVLQPISVSLSETEVIEQPWELGVEVRFDGIRLVEAKAVPVPQHEPYLSESRSPRIMKMSANISSSEIEAHFSPFESFTNLVEAELDSAITRCLGQKECKPILLAVSVLRDPEILLRLERAREVGIPVQVIVSPERRGHFPNFPPTYRIADSPWHWFRGNPHMGTYEGRLQMHTKFAVFGDSMAIGADLNITVLQRTLSRGLTVVHRNPEVVRMFQAIHAMIRTGTVYPLKIDRGDNYVLLLNYERPSSYVASALRPFTPIESEEGIVSNAYGIFLDTLRRTPGKLDLFMSPLTNDCFYYGDRICLFEEFIRRAKENKLSLGLSSYFYATRSGSGSGKPLWEDIDMSRREDWQMPRSKQWLQIFLDFPESREVYARRDALLTAHHERYGLLHPEIVISGSTNLVFPNSVNILELIRVPEMFEKVSSELGTYDEPYFVTPEHASIYILGEWGPASHGCRFIFERPLGAKVLPKIKKYRAQDLLATLRAGGDQSPLHDLRLVQPGPGSWTHPTSDSFDLREFGDSYESYASYQCVWNTRTNSAKVVRLMPAPP